MTLYKARKKSKDAKSMMKERAPAAKKGRDDAAMKEIADSTTSF